MEIVVRKPKALVIGGVVGGLGVLGYLWNFTLDQSILRLVLDVVGLVWWAGVFVNFVIGYLATSITVGPDVIMIRRWTEVERIATDAFVEVKPRTRQSPAMIISTGQETKAPWFHPNLTGKILRSIETVQHSQ